MNDEWENGIKYLNENLAYRISRSCVETFVEFFWFAQIFTGCVLFICC